MPRKLTALNSIYVIDGVRQEPTPERLLAAVSDTPFVAEDELGSPSAGVPDAEPSVIVDETLDAPVRDTDIDSLDPAACLDVLRSADDVFPCHSSFAVSKFLLISAIAESLWREGSFRLGNLVLQASWKWNEKPIGAMAAFYRSVEAACDVADSLALKFCSCSYGSSSDGRPHLAFSAVLGSGQDSAPDDEDEDIIALPYTIANPVMGGGRLCPARFVADPSSWVIYVPLDPAEFRLGGSLLSSLLGISGSDPHVEDADYFIDCYEVLREFAEDSVLLSAAVVGRGGLAACLESMCGDAAGLCADISGIMASYREQKPARVLFSEIPAVVIQIRDSDFDYVDAEMLLQDVAYFPLGHPDPARKGLGFNSSDKTSIQTILESLLQNAGHETE